MTGATTPGRRPLQIVELEQPRCVNRFGVSPCTATGTPKCYQTWTTCLDRVNFDSTGGTIKWRFVKSRAGQNAFGDFSDADNPETNGLPGLVSVSASSSKLNVAGILRGESPLGVRASVTVTLEDFPFDDHVGDFYTADRTIGAASFWEKWTARNKFYAGMYIRVYDGYEGQALADMRQRLYVLEGVDGPSNGRVTLKGRDPLRLADKRKAEFPRATDIELVSAIDEATTSIEVYSDAVDLTGSFGNTSEYYIRLGDEILSYTGTTTIATGHYSLDGVKRARLGTTAETGDAEQQLQRVGYYNKKLIWQIAHDLIVSHTRIPASFADLTAWNAAAASYLASFSVTGVVPEPVGVEELLGELCQQGQFSIWWDEFDQAINLIVVQPPLSDVPLLTDDANHLADSVSLVRQPEERVTRTFVYYSPFSWIDGLDDNTKFSRATVRVNGDAEDVNAADTVISRVIYSRWLRTNSQALSVTKRIEDLYGDAPEFLTVDVDAKDREYGIGTVLDVSTSAFKDTEGNPETRRWQVISIEELDPGHSYRLGLQTFPYAGKFAIIMADGTGSYASATEAERLSGCWFSEDTGLMPDGSEGYLLR